MFIIMRLQILVWILMVEGKRRAPGLWHGPEAFWAGEARKDRHPPEYGGCCESW